MRPAQALLVPASLAAAASIFRAEPQDSLVARDDPKDNRVARAEPDDWKLFAAHDGDGGCCGLKEDANAPAEVALERREAPKDQRFVARDDPKDQRFVARDDPKDQRFVARDDPKDQRFVARDDPKDQRFVARDASEDDDALSFAKRVADERFVNSNVPLNDADACTALRALEWLGYSLIELTEKIQPRDADRVFVDTEKQGGPLTVSLAHIFPSLPLSIPPQMCTRRGC
mgnify:CR=1 FL=1